MLLQCIAVGKAKAFMTHLYLAATIDHEAARHSVQGKLLRQNALGIEYHLESCRMVLQKALGIGVIAVDVNGDDDELLRSELLLQVIHERKRLATRGAPGSPEIQINDFSFEGGEVDRIARASRRGKSQQEENSQKGRGEK